MKREQVKQFVENHPELASKRATGIPGVFVLKYKNQVFYKNLWTPELCECRGTVIDEDYNIIQRPFTKIFNHGEIFSPKINLDTEVIAVRKVNGFMCAATWWMDDIFVSTTGSVNSKFADIAYKQLNTPNYRRMLRMYPNFTFIFEVCVPEDPHIIKEEFGVYLLGTRRKCWETPNHYHGEEVLDDFAYIYGFFRPEWKIAKFGDVMKECKYVEHEGFVVYTLDGNQELKMKSPFYLVTKMLGRMKDERLLDGLDNPEKLKQRMDEEFYDVIDNLSKNRYYFLGLGRQERIEYIRNFFMESNSWG